MTEWFYDHAMRLLKAGDNVEALLQIVRQANRDKDNHTFTESEKKEEKIQ